MVLSAIFVGCGGGAHAGKTDTVAPVIDGVSATLGDPNPGTLDLSTADDQRVIASPTPLTLKISASDDVTPTEKLEVQALDDGGQPIADQSTTLHNGLWQIVTTAKPGLSVHLAVADAAGNQAVWPHAAVFPTRQEALVRKWTLLVYDSNATVVARPHDTLTADTWCQDDDASGGGPRGGSWSVLQDGRLSLETRHHMACDTSNFGAEWDTIEKTRTADFYVDATDFSDRPYARQGGAASTDIVGTWTRSAEIATTGPSQTVASTLTLSADNTFQQSTEDGHQLAGTYEVRHNTDYTADFGDLLVLTTTQTDGVNVTPAVSVHYFTIRSGELLIDPFVEIQ